MSILVTGGSGFLGKRLKAHQPTWTYLSSKDVAFTPDEVVKHVYDTREFQEKNVLRLSIPKKSGTEEDDD